MPGRKHLERVREKLRDLERDGYVQQVATRIVDREPIYVLTEKGRRFGIERRLKGLL